MDKQKQTFVKQWEAKFPGTAAPDLEFKDVETIEQELRNCKENVKKLEEQLNQAKFQMIFLQTSLAVNKKSYERKRWGYGSSIESESDPSSPRGPLEKDESTESPFDNDQNSSIQSNVTNPVVMRSKASAPPENNPNRSSTVLENVKMFENISEESVPDSGNTPRNLSHRASSRKRAPYLEVWECKTGTDESKYKDAQEGKRHSVAALSAGTTDSFTAAAVSMMDSTVSGSGYLRKPLIKSQSLQDNSPHRVSAPPRDNYVEVWNCNTGSGDQVEQPDYSLEDIDAKDGYGKEHYTLAGSEVKLRESRELINDPVSNRLTWPATKANAPHEFQNENLGMADSIPMMSQTTVLTEESCDLSDLDVDESSTCSQSPPHSPNFGRESATQEDVKMKSRTFPERVPTGSPFHRLSQARTTNERIDALGGTRESYYSEEYYDDDYGEWVGSTPDHDSSHEFSEDDLEPDKISIGTLDSLPPHFNQLDDNVSLDSLDKEDDHVVSGAPGQEYQAHPSTDTSPTHGSFSTSENVSGMVDYHKVRSIAEAEKLRMRKWVISSLLDSEELYLEYLNTLLLYMKPLKATISTSMPVMSNQDFETLFYRVEELHSLHAAFYNGLMPRLQNWSADTQIGDLFQALLSKLRYYEDYVNNYKKAQHTAEKCAKENQQFADIIESLKVRSKRKEDSESISLIDILYKPAERVMRNTLVLQDILKHTPHRHPDYHTLRQALKQAQQFLNRINTSSSAPKGRKAPSSASLAAARTANRELVKDGYLVEISSDGGNQRKLRHVFLYSDLLLCAKQKQGAGMFHSKETYECKWYIPLADLSFKPTDDSEAAFDVPETSEDDLRELSNRAIELKKEITQEKKRLASRKGQSQSTGHDAPSRSSRQLERARKKLNEIEGQIVLSAPNLPLRIFHMQGREKIKCYMFLMSSDYERAEWTEAIMKQQESCFKSFSLTSIEVQSLLATCVKQRKGSNFGSMLINDDEDLLSGYLTVTVHSGEGFLHACNPYCTLEVDSYGHFQTKAKTRLCENTQKPEWEMEFELEVDGAQTLRILCYDRARGASYNDDVLIAKGKVGLLPGSLRSHDWIKENVLMNEIEIKLSVKFTPREQSLRRLPSRKSNGVFGVKIGQVTKREHGNVPAIVKMCVEEVERRGMDEVGIYRVSGVASEVKELKTYFDTNRQDVSLLLSNVDINAVAGVLKLYFRELPEPLFTDRKYNEFVDAVSLADPETKHNNMWRLLADLPPPNYHTLVYLRQHLLKIAEKDSVNKMTLHNLATVFGPTLLRPAEDPSKIGIKGSDVMLLSALRMDVHYQVGVLLYCLELPTMPELGAKTTGSKLMASIMEAEEESLTTVPKSVGPTQHPKPPVGLYGRTDSKSELSKSGQENRASVSRSATVDIPTSMHKTDRSIRRGTGISSSSAAQLRERYHNYEEVEISPMSRSPTKKLTNPVARTSSENTSSNNNSGMRRASHHRHGVAVLPPRAPMKPNLNKPVPAPRKPSMKKQNTLVTDL